MSNENNKIQFNIPELEKVLVHCDDKNNLLDYMWLFNHIPWCNHDNKIGNVVFDEPTEVFYIKMNGFDTKTSEIKKVECDELEIMSVHGTINHFTFIFYMNGERLDSVHDYVKIGFSKEDVKDRFVESLERKIKGLNNQINNTKDNIEFIKKL